ncbi:MAG TPA: uroporphyrinogen-III synthase [Vicinamibacteria bacterium]|nr:uroporphyrinogen-III synthase [Vicinamibacteria bacterium]
MAGVLAGRRIVVTRRPEQAGSLAAGLSALGAEVHEVPLVEMAAPSDPGPLWRAVAEIAAYDWVAFTSANAVGALADALERAGRALPPGCRVASVGPSTSGAVRERLGTGPALTPASDYRATGLVRAFDAVDLTGRRVLWPISDRARDALADGLRARGALVDAVVAYRTVAAAGAADALAGALRVGADLITLASPSAVEALVSALGVQARQRPVAVIGPVTGHAARAAGLDVKVVAAPATAEGLVAAIRRHFLHARP